jgi:hypothetical protein
VEVLSMEKMKRTKIVDKLARITAIVPIIGFSTLLALLSTGCAWSNDASSQVLKLRAVISVATDPMNYTAASFSAVS